MIQISTSSRQGIQTSDLVSHFANHHRTLLLCGEITPALACDLILQMEYLSVTSPEDILLYINSPGGSVAAGLALYDAMERSRCDIATVCLGTAASMAAVLLAAGTHGKRYCAPHGEVMIHQVLGGFQGQASDIEIAAGHLLACKEQLNRLLAAACGKPVDQVRRDCDRDHYLSAAQAIDYGLVDHLYQKSLLG